MTVNATADPPSSSLLISPSLFPEALTLLGGGEAPSPCAPSALRFCLSTKKLITSAGLVSGGRVIPVWARLGGDFRGRGVSINYLGALSWLEWRPTKCASSLPDSDVHSLPNPDVRQS